MSGQHYQVEKILDRRLDSKTKKHQYLIKWEDYPMSQATWEPENHLITCKKMVLDFNKKYARESALTTTKAKFTPITNIEQSLQAQTNPEYQDSDESDTEEEFNRLLLKKAKGLLKKEKKHKKESETSESQKGSEIVDSYRQEIDFQAKQSEEVTYAKKNEFPQTALRTCKLPSSPEKGIRTNANFMPCEKCMDDESLLGPPQEENSEANPVLDRVRSIDCDTEEGIVIRGMYRNESQAYMYRVAVKGKAMVRSRQWVIKNDPMALIKYYEKNIKFRATAD